MCRNCHIFEKERNSYSELRFYPSFNQYNASYAWNVNTNNGNVNYNDKTYGNQVRAVSDSQEWATNPLTSSRYIDFVSDMFRAYLLCIKTKRTNPNAVFYALRWMRSTITLADEIWTGKYQIKNGISFIANKPVFREIFAASFRNRVAGDWCMMRLIPIFESIFPEPIMANRVGRGNLAASRTIQRMVYDLTNGYKEDVWMFSFDFQRFFVSIDKRITLDKALGIIEKHYEGWDKPILKYLFSKIILNCPQKTATRRSPLWAWDNIQPEKSLYNQDDNYGLPIGNQPSQWSACMLVMFALEIFARHGFIWCVNYMDDTIFCVKDKEKQLREIPAVEKELKEELGITLHPNKRGFQHYTKGWQMVGYRGKPNSLYVGKRSLRKSRAKIHYQCKAHETDGIVQSLNSYLGVMRHCKSYNYRKELADETLNEFSREIYFVNGITVARLKKQYNERYLAKTSIRYVRTMKTIVVKALERENKELKQKLNLN